MTVRVIPLLRLGRKCGLFDYAVPEALQSSICPGQLATLQFRNKKAQGIIWRILTDDVAQDLKCIDSLIQNKPLVTQKQMEFLEWFSYYYSVSLAHAASIFIPSRPKKITRKTLEQPSRLPAFRFKEQKQFSLPSHNEVRMCFDWNGYASYVFHACSYHIRARTQLLILTPSLHDAQLLYSFLHGAFPQRIAFATGDSSASSLANAYALLAEEMCSVVISTRIALGWNMPALASIILLDAESRDYKQYDKNPRFDARTAAEHIAQNYCVPLVFLTMSPSCEILARSDHTGITTLEQSHTDELAVLLIDLVRSFRSGNHAFISTDLQESIRLSLDSKKGVFLFLNRKGYGGLVRCSECQLAFSCEACKLPQRYSKRENALRCTLCKETRTLPSSCPHCGSHDFSFRGIGIEKIAQDAAQLFPRARIIEMDADSPLSSDTLDDLSSTIIVGTSAFLQCHWEACEHIGCIGVIAADLLPSLSDFRAIEYQWHMLMRLAGTARAFSIPLVLQAFDTQSVPMQCIAADDWKRCISWQLEQRKRFGWPPYSRIIKIIARHHTALLPHAVPELMKKLQQAFVLHKGSITLFRSTAMQFERRPYLLIRITGEYEPSESLPLFIHNTLSGILDDWLIDIDPVTF